ncbi:MAG: hypothetical protein WCG78_05740 [Candidatus Omnitrophota bacterium]
MKRVLLPIIKVLLRSSVVTATGAALLLSCVSGSILSAETAAGDPRNSLRALAFGEKSTPLTADAWERAVREQAGMILVRYQLIHERAAAVLAVLYGHRKKAEMPPQVVRAVSALLSTNVIGDGVSDAAGILAAAKVSVGFEENVESLCRQAAQDAAFLSATCDRTSGTIVGIIKRKYQRAEEKRTRDACAAAFFGSTSLYKSFTTAAAGNAALVSGVVARRRARLEGAGHLQTAMEESAAGATADPLVAALVTAAMAKAKEVTTKQLGPKPSAGVAAVVVPAFAVRTGGLMTPLIADHQELQQLLSVARGKAYLRGVGTSWPEERRDEYTAWLRIGAILTELLPVSAEGDLIRELLAEQQKQKTALEREWNLGAKITRAEDPADAKARQTAAALARDKAVADELDGILEGMGYGSAAKQASTVANAAI